MRICITKKILISQIIPHLSLIEDQVSLNKNLNNARKEYMIGE